MDGKDIGELRKAYALLHESNEKLYNSMKAFQIAAEECGSLVFSYDTKKQMILVDEKTAEAFGVETVQTGVPYEMARRGIISEDTQEEYIRIHEAMINGAKDAGGIVKLIPAVGKEIVYDLKFRAILNEEGDSTGTAVGVYRDITERYLKDMEHERYRQIIYSSERYTFQYDGGKDSLTVFPAHYNAAKGGEKGYLIEEYTQKLQSGKICPESDIPILQDLLQNGAKKPVQVQLYGVKTGKKRWYAVTGAVVCCGDGQKSVAGTVADITDIKQQELSHRKLEHVLQSLKDEYIGIFEIDLEKDAYSVLSYDKKALVPDIPESGCYSEVMEMVAKQLTAPEYIGMFREFTDIERLRRVLAEERRIELEYRTNSLNNRWRRTVYQVAERIGERPSKAIMYQLDIDKIKVEKLMQQQAMQEAYNYAEAANTAKSEFLSRMSHDIRTPMNAIVGFTAIAEANIEDHEQVKKCLAKITTASEHLLSLINEVLDMSKIESGKMELQEEEFNLSGLIDDMVAMVQPQMSQRRHCFEVQIGELQHERAIGDRLRIQQAFVNLVSNAAKYTPDGGKISIRIRERALKNPGYGEYEFIFEDNGIGMTKEFQQELFEPFARAEDSRVAKINGTGLGMTITRNLIRMMDGEIRVDSSINKGSRFTVTIHLKLPGGQGEKIDELKGKRVLVADDDIAAGKKTCAMLEEIGLSTEFCVSGEQAVERVKACSRAGDSYFAAVLNWKMPGISGPAAAKEMCRQLGKDLPVIIVSAYDWSKIEEEARALDIEYFIAKPLPKSRLVQCLREIMRRTEREKEAAGPADPPDYSDKRVLLVEDNDLNAEIACELLRMEGVRTEWAGNGKEAVRMVEDSPEGYYDMVFMDIQMPVLNGYDAAREIRKLERKDVRDMPIVAMTANAFAEDVGRAKDAGMNEHIAKPVDLNEMRAVMARYLP